MIPSGAPARRAASAKMRAVSAMHRLADGCGLRTTALRAFIEIKTLNIVVEVGLVDGMIAATTPSGDATSHIFLSRSSRRMPTVFMPLMAS